MKTGSGGSRRRATPPSAQSRYLSPPGAAIQIGIKDLFNGKAGKPDSEYIIAVDPSAARPIDVASHPVASSSEPDGNFYYSYTLNNLMQSDGSTSPPNMPTYTPTNSATGKRYRLAMKLTNVKLPQQKLLLAEEKEVSLTGTNVIDDGALNPLSGTNLLAIRHDRTARLPDSGQSQNNKCRGNVLFCDGHVEYAPRAMINDTTVNKAAILPYWPGPDSGM